MSTARYHTGTQQCAFETSPYTCFVTVRSHSGTFQPCTTVLPWLLETHAIAHALVWQCLAFSYFSKCVWSFEFCAGLSLRYNVQTCPEATTTKTDKQTNKQTKTPSQLQLHCLHNATMLRIVTVTVVRPVLMGDSTPASMCSSSNMHQFQLTLASVGRNLELRMWSDKLTAPFDKPQSLDSTTFS